MNPAEIVSEEPSVKVLYIAGFSRSGSTLLQRILGEIEGMVAVGELGAIWAYGLRNDLLCECGQAFSRCDFWQAVMDEAFGGPRRIDLPEVERLRGRMQMRRIPQFVNQRLRSRAFQRDLDDYSLIWRQLLLAIKSVSGARIIVDSSKVPTLVYLLYLIEDVDPRVIHLVRDSRAAAFSYRRRKLRPEFGGAERHMARHNIAVTSLSWGSWNTVIDYGRLAGQDILRVRYEDFIQHPRIQVERILEHASEPDLDLDFLRQPALQFHTGHSIGGNPVRFDSGEIKLMPDFSWREQMPFWQKSVVTCLTWPLLWRYGYLSDGG